jgi:hypothetical protein
MQFKKLSLSIQKMSHQHHLKSMPFADPVFADMPKQPPQINPWPMAELDCVAWRRTAKIQSSIVSLFLKLDKNIAFTVYTFPFFLF